MFYILLIFPHHSTDVRQYLWQRKCNHSTALLGHGPLPHSDAEGQGVHSVPSDPEPAASTTGGVLPARVVVHKRHRHEHGTYTSLLFVCGDLLVVNGCGCVTRISLRFVL